MNQTTTKNPKRRKLKFIGCEIIYREGSHLAAGTPHQVDVEFLRKGLHDLETPDMLAKVQGAIDAVDPQVGYEAIVLGYARCNNGLVGITAREIPLVIPKAHDCITFFLGSRKAYRDSFDSAPGTYYMTTGWSERNAESVANGALLPPVYGMEGVMEKLGLDQSYEQLVAKHGKENADYIIAALGNWKKNYTRMLYLEMGVCDERPFIAEARRTAEQNHWTFEQRKGDWTLLEKLFFGRWDDDFLIVKPHQRIIARNDEEVLGVAD